MPTTWQSYLGPLPNIGTKTGTTIRQTAASMFPQQTRSGGTSTPVPVAEVLQGGTNGVSYSETITAEGGVSPYTFAVTGGALPTGTSLSSGGLISGTPTVNGTYTFTVTATDANGSTGSTTFQITIISPAATGGSWVFG